MRKALIIGLDNYTKIPPLTGCVNDAYEVKSVLEHHGDGKINFATPRLVVSREGSTVTRSELKTLITELFSGEADIALLYFAGHGFSGETGGYLCAEDTSEGDDGLPIAEVMILANKSKAKNKVIILDSCFSGEIANNPNFSAMAEIKEGTTILTAATADQYAMEDEKEGSSSGLFTSLLVDALRGSATNLLGEITPGSVYAHIDQSLGPWSQRPVFKTNVQTFISLRNVAPLVELDDLRKLTVFFERIDYQIPLDPSFEPDRNQEQINDPTIADPDPENVYIFELLQKFVKVNLVTPVGEKHMFYAAMNSKSCELTVLGQHYYKLIEKCLI